MNTLAWPLPHRRVLLADPDIDPEAPAMQFRLTYAGPLFAASSGNNRVNHKHDIRRALHPQLRAYWDHHPFLRDWRGHTEGPSGYDSRQLMRHELAGRFARCGYRFVPLVTREWELYCAINVLYLRPGWPGNVIHDIDNRLKTLFDALRLPADASQLGKHLTPEQDEDPFYCLLEDDSLITQVAVETDVLLEPISPTPTDNDVRLVISVSIGPTRVTMMNSSFSGR